MQNSTDRTERSVSRNQDRGSISVFVLCVVMGLVYLGIGVATGRPGFGAVGLGIMLAYALVLALLRRRSETAGLLSGDVRDERQALVLNRAAAFTGYAMVIVVLGGYLWALATRSELAGLFSALAAVAGVAFIAGVAVSTRRT